MPRKALSTAIFLFILSIAITHAAPSIEVVDSVGTVGRQNSYGRQTSLVLDAAGNPVIAYFDETNLDLKLAHCNDPGCVGGDEHIETIDSDGGMGEQFIALVLDSSGNPVIGYHDRNNFDVKLAHCNDVNCAGGDESVEVVDSNGDVGESISLALDGSGYPVMSYYDLINGSLKLAHCNDVNCAGGDESFQLVDSGGFYTALVLDQDGNPVIAYSHLTQGLKLAHCNDANCNGGDESIQLIESGSNNGSYVALVLDPDGNPIISYLNVSQQHLKLAHCGNPNCSSDNHIQVVDNGPYAGRDSSLALDSNGNPIISYFRYFITYDLKLAYCGDPNCSSGNSIQFIDSEGDVGAYTSLVLDSAGNPVISYFDESNADVRLMHCDTRYCVPELTIDDVSVYEDSGTATFTLSLGTTSNFDVVVDYSTADDTASAPDDYTSITDSITIPAGEQLANIVVPLVHDAIHENEERFFVNILAATNAVIADNQGIGVIRTDRIPDAPDASPERNFFTVLPVTLTWGIVTWAVEYELQVADNRNFSQPTSYIVSADTMYYEFDSLSDGIYYWRVRARTGANQWGAWSQIDSFTLAVS